LGQMTTGQDGVVRIDRGDMGGQVVIVRVK
jgi:hypothetical protein